MVSRACPGRRCASSIIVAAICNAHNRFRRRHQSILPSGALHGAHQARVHVLLVAYEWSCYVHKKNFNPAVYTDRPRHTVQLFDRALAGRHCGQQI
jgi:hypothetical protein